MYFCRMLIFFRLTTALNDDVTYNNFLIQFSYNEHNINLEKCLLNICENYAKTAPTTIFSEDITNFQIADNILHKFTGQTIIKSKYNFETVDGFYLFFTEINNYEINNFETNATLYDIVNLKLILQTKLYEQVAMNVLVIMNKNTPDISQHLVLAIVKRYMDEFWKMRLINLIVLFEIGNTINIYTYYPYAEDHCSQVGQPVLLEIWDSYNNKFLLDNHNLFPIEDKINNLHGCALNGIGKTRPPESIIIPRENNTWELGGTGGFMLKLLETTLNFTTHIAVPANDSEMDEFGYSVSDGIPEIITRNLVTHEKDFAFGVYSYIIYFFPGTEFPKAALSECFIWYAPCRAGRKPSDWDNYVKEFSNLTWTLIITIFTLIVLVNKVAYDMVTSLQRRKHKTNKDSESVKIIIIVFAISLGQSVGRQIKYLAPKYLAITWIYYCFVIYSTYQASMGSFMTVPWYTKNVETYQEILEFNFKIVGNPQSFNIYNKSIDNNNVVKQIAQRYKKVSVGTYDTIIKQMVDDRDTVAFGAQRFHQHYSVHRTKNVTSKDPICVIGDCVIESSASPFLLKKGSPLIKPINKITTRMLESGILNWLWVGNQPNTEQLIHRIQRRKFEFKHLNGAILLYIIGKSLAIIAFIFEHIYYYRQRKKIDKKVH